MFTNVEGEWDDVMTLIKESVEKAAERAPRVSVVIKIDHPPNRPREQNVRVVMDSARPDVHEPVGGPTDPEGRRSPQRA
jgi:uncharacterized protein YqgV (UPF0045/DUF77 family)